MDGAPTEARAQVFEGLDRGLRYQALPVPARLAPGEVLVEIQLATICGSDLHTLAGHRREPVPAILGHEAVGRVIACEGRPGLRPGHRVSWTIADSCGACLPCTRHHLPQKCERLFKYGHAPVSDGSGLNGCYASHILLRAGTHIATPDESLPDAVIAPANCALATMVNAVAELPDACDCVLIQGAGMLGLYGCALLHHRGVRHVFCTDVQEQRLARVPDFGGIPVDARPEHYPDSRGQIEGAAPHGIDAAIEVAGVAALVPEGLRLLRPGGVYALVGMVHPDTALALTGEQVIRKCLTLRGVHNYGPRHLDEALAFLGETADHYPYESLVSPPYRLTDLPEALRVARTQQYGRVAVSPEDP